MHRHDWLNPVITFLRVFHPVPGSKNTVGCGFLAALISALTCAMICVILLGMHMPASPA